MAKQRRYSFVKGLKKAGARMGRAAIAAAGVAAGGVALELLEAATVQDLVGLGLPSVVAFAVLELANNYRKNRTR